ncbi:hypothetical protein Tco_1317014 [Tanacetum coccineum]
MTRSTRKRLKQLKVDLKEAGLIISGTCDRKNRNRRTSIGSMRMIRTISQLKSKSYDEIQEMFDKEMKRVNTFVDMNAELVKGNEHVEAEKDYDHEEAEMKKHIEIIKDDEVAIDAIPLATKPLMIVEYKIVKE